jgi:MoxR-like ATPase
LLARTSAPEELFGPVSLKALENDSYKRVTTNKLPEANVAFLDEIWKCNSAVLNSLLSVLNERLFFNDGQPVTVPLQMAVGASNELPEDREQLGALWDRFGLRYVVGYLRDPRAFENMLALATTATTTTIGMEKLAQAQAEVSRVDVSKVIAHIPALRGKLTQEQITVSDRRWRMALDLVRANAWLEGRKVADTDDLGILAAALWTDPQQINKVRSTILSMVNPLDLEAQDLLDQAQEIHQNAIGTEGQAATKIGIEANAKLRTIAQRLEALANVARDKGKTTQRIAEITAQVNELNREVLGKCLGVSAK